jgi:hypothetical protein
MARPKPPQTTPAKPQIISVGLPHVPALYGLKPRKNHLSWKHAEERLVRSRNYWICTARPDGRPHSIPVWGYWIDGAFYFGTARSSRKARNLAGNPAVSMHLESGDDVVIVEGRVAEVKDRETFRKIDDASTAKYKMPLMTVPGETVIYCLQPRVVLAWTEKNFPHDATRWEFGVRTKAGLA